MIKDFERFKLVKPTFIQTNDFTMPFQEIVNTYGVPNYKEVNPAIFAAVSFPFLFGVMFGDVFHGTMLFVFASYLCLTEIKEGSSLFLFGKARYLLLMMGFFSTFCGFMYNDFTSIPLELFGTSCYQVNGVQGTPEAFVEFKELDCIYPVGFDPFWY
jgi:V-type H+-transporting ATPase subunit a